MSTDFGIKRTADDAEMELSKKLFVLNCHAAEVVFMDTFYIHIRNPESLAKELEVLKQYGFKGKFAIHPTQVDIINKAFSPDPKEIDYFRRLVEAFEKAMEEGKAAMMFDNKMCRIKTITSFQIL